MANAEKIFFYPEQGNLIEYTKVDDREGTHGLVHIVQRENDYFVLKEPKNHDRESVSLFTDYKETFKGRSLPKHFVKVQDYGHLGNPQGKEDNRPALLMPYAGRDVKWIFEQLKGFTSIDSETPSLSWDIKPNVREALMYKVMLTLLEGLEDAHSKKLYHSDLKPQNVMIGVPYGFGRSTMNPEDIERILLESRVQVCDPIFEQKHASKLQSLSSTTKFHHYFKYLFGGMTLEQEDCYAAIAISTWLSEGDTLETPSDFLRKSLVDERGNPLEITTTREGPHKVTRSFPSATSLRKSIETKAKEFYILGKKKVEGSVSEEYPIVLRPLDSFRTYVSKVLGADAIGLEEVKAIAGSPGNTQGFSYAALRHRYEKSTETRRSATELAQLEREYLSAASTAAQRISKAKVSDTILKAKVDSEISRNDQAIASLNEKITTYQKDLSTVLDSLGDISTKLTSVSFPARQENELTAERTSILEEVVTLPQNIRALSIKLEHNQSQGKIFLNSQADYQGKISSQAEALEYIAIQLVPRHDFPSKKTQDYDGLLEVLRKNVSAKVFENMEQKLPKK